MKSRILALVLLIGMFFTIAPSGMAAVYYRRPYRTSAARARYLRHKRHMRTVKRVAIGAAGGAAIGAIAGGAKGGAIGAIAGAGAGALYDGYKHRH